MNTLSRKSLHASFIIFSIALAGCEQQAENSAAIPCEGSSGYTTDVLPGECTDPCPEVSSDTLQTMQSIAKTEADTQCKLEGKNSCDGTHSNPGGSCSTTDVDGIPHCEYRMSLTYSGTCI